MKKTLSYQDCLDEIAYKYGFSSFEEIDLGATLKGGKSIVNLQEEAAEKYAKQFKRRIAKVGKITTPQLINFVAEYEKWLDGHKKPVFTGKGKRGLMLLDFAKHCQAAGTKLLGTKTRKIK